MDSSEPICALSVSEHAPSTQGTSPKSLEVDVNEGDNGDDSDSDGPHATLAAIQYQPLDHRSKQIRLLNIINGDYSHYIQCTLKTVSLDYNELLPRYLALSYCWGTTGSSTSIFVDGCRVEATRNLDAALRQLRLRGYLSIWVDAICVNQADRIERGQQVQIMKQIYSSAESVVSWVGSAEDDTAEAVKFLLERPSSSLNLQETTEETMSMISLPRIGHQERDELAHDESAQNSPRYSRLEKAKRRWIRNQWSIIQDFFNQDYWKRVWIIQEVAVATHLKVLFGRSEISWDNVAAAIVLWKETLLSLPTSHLSHLYAAQLLDLRNRYVEGSPISLLYAMLVTNKAMSTDPRDKVFALLGLTYDGPSLIPSPDYKDSLKDIMCNLIRAMILAENSLDVICIRSLYPPATDEHPSWIPPWFTNADFSFWSNPMTILESHLLSSQSTFYETPSLNSGDPGTLSVQGIILDEVYVLSSSLGHASNPSLSGCEVTQCNPANQYRLERNITNFYPSGPTNALWQALCMEHTFHPVRTEGEYYNFREVSKYRSCFASLFAEQFRPVSTIDKSLRDWVDENASLKIGSLTIEQWAKNGVLRNHCTVADMDAFCRVLMDVLKSSMRLFVTGFGYLGMAPSQTREGDRICFLRGCSVPVVLRGTSEAGYKIVGCCSVRTRFEPYAEACVRFAAGKVHRESEPALNIKELHLI